MAVFDEQYVMSNLSSNNQRPFRDPLELPDVANTLDMDDELKADSYTGGLNVNRGILQSLTDKGKEAFGFLKNKGAMIGGGVASAITGIPFLGTAFNALQRPEYPSDAMSKSFAYGNENSGGDLGYYDALRHGNLTGQDQFGINTVSALGNYPAYYSEYVKDYEDGKYSTSSKFGFEKYMHGKNVINKNRERIEKDFFVNDDNDGNDNITYTPPSNNDNGNQNQGDMDSYGVDKDTGNPGNYDQDYDMKDGGRAGYFFGGRARLQGGGMSQGNEENQKQSAEMGNTTVSNNNNNNDGGGNNTPTISKFVGSNVIESPFGELGGNTDTKIGYRGGVDLAKLGLTMGVDGTLTNRNFLTNDDIENKGTFYTGTDNDIFNTATTYDDSGIRDTVLNSNNPYGDFGVTVDNNGNLVQGNYENNYKGVDVNATTNFDDLNNISLSKFSGDPTKNGFSYGIGANVDPSNLSNSNAYLQARYAFGQGKKDGGRIGFKNGGLAGLL